MYPNKPTFTSYWFEPHQPRWTDIVVPRYEDVKDAQWLEVGTYEGRSAFWTVENVLKGDKKHITCVDTWDGSDSDFSTWGDPNYEKTFDENVKGDPRFTKLKGRSSDILPTLSSQKFHGAYIDGSHTFANAYLDASLVWNLLLVDSIMVLDDYRSPKDPGVREAVNTFLSEHRGRAEILGESVCGEYGQIFILKKQPPYPSW
jgi:predicted O-methyltransferase YrrM